MTHFGLQSELFADFRVGSRPASRRLLMAGPLYGLQRSKRGRTSGLSPMPVALKPGSEEQRLARLGSWLPLGHAARQPSHFISYSLCPDPALADRVCVSSAHAMGGVSRRAREHPRCDRVGLLKPASSQRPHG
jgi:hypothetical protein